MSDYDWREHVPWPVKSLDYLNAIEKESNSKESEEDTAGREPIKQFDRKNNKEQRIEKDNES